MTGQKTSTPPDYEPPYGHVVVMSEQPAAPVMMYQPSYGGPAGFYTALGFTVGGYVAVWLGLILLAANIEEVVVPALWVQGLGIVSAVVGSIVLCKVAEPRHEGRLCRNAILATIAFTVLVLIPYIVLIFTRFKSTDSASNDGDDTNWDNLGRALMMVYLLAAGVATVGIYGCVSGCFWCCVVSSKQVDAINV